MSNRKLPQYQVQSPTLTPQIRTKFQSRSFGEQTEDVLAHGEAASNRTTQVDASPRGHNFGQIPLVQPKLTVGAPNDQYEQEADRVSDQVMTMSAPGSQPGIQRQAEDEELQTKPIASTITPLVQREAVEDEELQTKLLIQREAEEEELQTKPLIQRETAPEEEELQTKPLIQREEAPEEEELQTKPLIQRETAPEEEELQTKPLIQREETPEEEELQTKRLQRKGSDRGFNASSSLENRLHSTKGGGSPLPNEVRAFMEPRFGADFSKVRVHTGDDAIQMNREVGAQAFTHGHDVYFGAGKAPGNDPLTAHELTHVVQQTGAVQPQRSADETVTRTQPALATESLLKKNMIQAAKEQNVTPWGSTYMSVEVKPIPNKLIGNLGPESTGSYPVGYDYGGRLAYKGDAYGGIDGPRGNVSYGGRASLEDVLKFSRTLKSTLPGTYTAYLGNKGGTFADAIRAEEQFTVVDPVKIDLGSRQSKQILDFDNPIPIQMEGGVDFEFQLNASHVHTKQTGISATGSSSNSISDKVSFGIKVGLDNDEGSTGGADFGFSTETSHSWKEQWQREKTHKNETTTGNWQKETFTVDEKEKGHSKMIIPEYEWVEWNAEVYPHSASTLEVTGAKKTVVIGMLRPTGSFTVQKSTDPGKYSNSNPTENAQTDVDRSDKNLKQQSDEQAKARGGWRTLQGAKWGKNSLQFIQGPISMQPAARDYGMQDGKKIHPGKGALSAGTSISMTLEDGMTASFTQESEHVTTNSVSKAFEANPGIKGLGSLGDSLSFENANTLSSATGTGLSSSSSQSEQTQMQVSYSVERKRTQNQYILYTPLVDHKVFKVAYGAEQPADGSNAVDPNTACSIFYLHTYQHQFIPHVKVMDVRRDETPARGRYDWPDFTSV